MSDTNRKSHRHTTAISDAVAVETGVMVTAATTLQPSYLDGIKVAVSANDASPNSTPPAAARIIFGGDAQPATSISQLALFPVFTAAGALELMVWCLSGLAAADGPVWVPVKKVLFDGSTDVETRVDVGNRTSFVQVVSGGDTHTCSLHIAVA